MENNPAEPEKSTVVCSGSQSHFIVTSTTCEVNQRFSIMLQKNKINSRNLELNPINNKITLKGEET